MAKPKPCRCKKSECEECPEWIFTFADLVMLMMGFFVILWVLKPSPSPKSAEAAQADENMIKLAVAVREAFGYVAKTGTADPVDNYMLNRTSQPKIPDGPLNKGKSKVRPDGETGTDPDVTAIRPGQQAVVGGRVLFDRGEVRLTAAAQHQLDEVADAVRGNRIIVLVKGHTSLDDLEDSASAQQKLDISIRRAQLVSDYLISKGVEPDILRVEGCSTFEPIVLREYEPSSQSTNRRVEVEATNIPVTAMQSPATQPTQSTQP
jgi:outer membrane protein OmpA-like peptidoglycan-associated protein